jgi:hypothetical protein
MAYTAPTVSEFQSRFPEFEDVDDELVQFAIDDATRMVGTNWIEADYKTGILLASAHLTQTIGGAYDSGGLKAFSLGPISVTYADGSSIAELNTTSYGQQFISLRNRNVRGPLVV